MSKISKKIMIVLALSLVFVMVFAGCTSTKQDPIPGGKADAVVESNGGLAVKQGDYIYYINGLVAVGDIKLKTDNEFGKVVKGSIMRGELYTDGDKKGMLKENSAKVVVPLVALSSNKNGGIHVFGNWIYYTSPSVKMDKYENLQTTFLEYKRTSLDGTITQDIATVEGHATEYKFTENALIYFTEGTITRVSYDDNSIGKSEVVAEKVGSVVFARDDKFDPAKDKQPDDVIFYTKASENDKDQFNFTYAVGTAAGSTPVEIINGKTYGENKKTQYMITLKFANVVGENIELYYEKANANDPENKTGIFGALYDGTKLDVANEVRMTGESQATVYPVSLEKGLYVLANNKLTLRREVVDEATGIIKYFDKDSEIELPSGAVIVDFIKYKYFFNDKEKLDSVLYVANNKLFVRPMTNDKKYSAVAITDEKDYAIDSSWLIPDVVDGKAYFFNTNYYKYIETIDIETGYMVKNADGKLLHPFANLNEKDKEDLKKKQEEENKNNK